MTPQRTFIDIHLLQSVPPSCINRDETGSPKSARYGGVRRARVSSQAWKRATRKRFAGELDESDLGVRTKRVVDLVAEQVRAGREDVDPETAVELAAAVVDAAGLGLEKSRDKARVESKYLVLVSRQQAGTLARLALDAFESTGEVASAVKALAGSKKQAKHSLATGNSVDLALFGRMVADDTDLNVDAACQVAHALSVHAAANEFDYFTAVDDLKVETAEGEAADAGAGMIGTVEFTSATLYRYATIDVDELIQSLGDVAMAQRGIEAFLRSFVLSMPTGKSNTFANWTVPEGVVVTVRTDQPMSWVGAFEQPVPHAPEGGYAEPAAEAMVAWASELSRVYAPGARTWTVGLGRVGAALAALGDSVPFAELPARVAAQVTADRPALA
ncbi:MAG: type I-E CRISPR-associated protein Cas7/Cse4/CasC [Cellulomonas sp.]|nr:type I-E CRISPR-associated protein Cas7/Cse4/CasC [Cellulomonas sp.]